ncbi:CBL-interacting serine/threonine-protein kinase 11 [Spatholobus suberectus]|nr:CBL-interacting serine/threonine-protein kinase 11 [Spatholobus suberectus]
MGLDQGRVPGSVKGREGVNLNAFDIISFSSGLDLSGLFGGSGEVEWLVARESPEKVLEAAEEAAVAAGMAVRWKKECGVELEGLNGRFGIGVEVYRLTAELAVVEVRKRGGDAVAWRSVWEERLKPLLLGVPRRRVVLKNNNNNNLSRRLPVTELK